MSKGAFCWIKNKKCLHNSIILYSFAVLNTVLLYCLQAGGHANGAAGGKKTRKVNANGIVKEVGGNQKKEINGFVRQQPPKAKK